MNPVDIFVQTFFLHSRTQGLTEFMFIISRIFDVTIYSVLITILVTTFIYFVRGRRFAILFIGSMTFGAIISYLLKLFFNVSRPTQAVFDVFGQSFPSYHAVIVTIFFTMMIYTFGSYLKAFWRKFFNTFCVLSILLVSFSRIYLGVHWLTDVLGGILLGVIVSYASVKIYKLSQ